MSFKKITRFTRIIIYTRITGFSGNLRFTIITRLPWIARFNWNIRFARCENCKILAKSKYDELSKYSRYMDCATSSVCVWLCENYIDKVSKKTMTLTMPLWPMRMVHRWDTQNHLHFIQSTIIQYSNKKVKVNLNRYIVQMGKTE